MKRIILAMCAFIAPAFKVENGTLTAEQFAEIEKQAGANMDSFEGEDDFDGEDDFNGEDDYDGIGDHELEGTSGFYGDQVNGSDVVNFTFTNNNETAQDFYFITGFKTLTPDGAPLLGSAKDGTFKSVQNLDLTCTGSPNCNINDLQRSTDKYPTRVLGFDVSANSIATPPNPGAAVTQIKTLGLELVQQSIKGDTPPQVIKVGLGVDGNQFNQNMAKCGTEFQIDFATCVKIRIQPKMILSFDFYLGVIQNSALSLARKHRMAKRNIGRKPRY